MPHIPFLVVIIPPLLIGGRSSRENEEMNSKILINLCASVMFRFPDTMKTTRITGGVPDCMTNVAMAEVILN